MMVEVLQTEWNAFTESIVKCVDLDQLRQKHEEMVNKIIDKCLLTEKSLPLYRTLLKIFDLILRFRYNQVRKYASTNNIMIRMCFTQQLLMNFTEK